MRIPRTILLGLSPLLSLWALGAQLGADIPRDFHSQAAEQQIAADQFHRFIEPMVSFLLLAAGQESAAAVTHDQAPQAVLALDALRITPYRGSLWLVLQRPATDLHSLHHPFTLLRC